MSNLPERKYRWIVWEAGWSWSDGSQGAAAHSATLDVLDKAVQHLKSHPFWELHIKPDVDEWGWGYIGEGVVDLRSEDASSAALEAIVEYLQPQSDWRDVDIKYIRAQLTSGAIRWYEKQPDGREECTGGCFDIAYGRNFLFGVECVE